MLGVVGQQCWVRLHGPLHVPTSYIQELKNKLRTIEVRLRSKCNCKILLKKKTTHHVITFGVSLQVFLCITAAGQNVFLFLFCFCGGGGGGNLVERT